jgi:hypothetical protein
MLKNFKLRRRVYRCIQLLFHFRRPRVEFLDYIDVVVTQKPLLLISWTSKYPYLFEIPIVRKRYYTCSGSVLIKLPTGLETIEIIVRSLWRRRTYILHLKSFAIDSRTFGEYMNSYKILNSSNLHDFDFNVSTGFSIQLPEVKIYKTQPKIAIPSFSISIPTFQQTKSSTNA